MKKIIAISCLFFTQFIYANTCPTTTDIKNNNFNGWRAFNINSGEPLGHFALEKFRKSIKKAHFALAEWMPEAPEGPAHCYYADGAGPQSYLEGYLVKGTEAPDTTSGKWWKESLNVLKCNVSPDVCRFGGSI